VAMTGGRARARRRYDPLAGPVGLGQLDDGSRRTYGQFEGLVRTPTRRAAAPEQQTAQIVGVVLFAGALIAGLALFAIRFAG
jgi:hypothetical protein